MADFVALASRCHIRSRRRNQPPKRQVRQAEVELLVRRASGERLGEVQRFRSNKNQTLVLAS